MGAPGQRPGAGWGWVLSWAYPDGQEPQIGDIVSAGGCMVGQVIAFDPPYLRVVIRDEAGFCQWLPSAVVLNERSDEGSKRRSQLDAFKVDVLFSGEQAAEVAATQGELILAQNFVHSFKHMLGRMRAKRTEGASWAATVERESAEQALQEQLGELRAWAQEQLGEVVTLHQYRREEPLAIGVSWIGSKGVDLHLMAIGRDVDDIIPALRRLVENQAAAKEPRQ